MTAFKSKVAGQLILFLNFTFPVHSQQQQQQQQNMEAHTVGSPYPTKFKRPAIQSGHIFIDSSGWWTIKATKTIGWIWLQLKRVKGSANASRPDQG
jgi:hypothetical protein